MKQLKPSLLTIYIASLFALLILPQTSYAIKGFPGTVQVSQPDGTKISILIHGDEFFNYYTTTDGYTIAKAPDGYFYYADYNTGKARLSATKVGVTTKNIVGLKKGVPQYVIDFERSKAIKEIDRNVSLFLTRSTSFLKPKKALVILVQYPDVKFATPNPKTAFSDLMNQKGYSANGGTGSAADYFEDNSMGQYRPEFVVTEPVTLPNVRSYYGSLNQRYAEHARDACNAAKAAGVNFTDSDFDSNNDGTLDVVLIYFAGHNAAEGIKEAVWPHKGGIVHFIDGKKIGPYACSSELRGSSGTSMSGIGTMCHEFGHVLGLSDIYTTKSGTTKAAALWSSLCVMDAGNYNNSGRTPPCLTSFEREMLGWMEIPKITNTQTYTLGKINDNKAYKIETNNPGEYYVLENRQSEGWDKYIRRNDTSDPKGMIIIHIDRSLNAINYSTTAYDLWHTNQINNFVHHQCADLVEACNHEQTNAQIYNVFYPGATKNTAFGHNTNPNNRAWNGSNVGVEIKDIRLDGDKVLFSATTEAINESKAQFRGNIKDTEGLLMVDLEMSLFAATPTQFGTLGSLISITPGTKTSSSPKYKTISNSIGNYHFQNVEPGDYIMEIRSPFYKTYSEAIILNKGENTKDLTLNMGANHPTLNTIKWHNGNANTYYSMSSGSIYAGVEFSPEDMATYKSTKISKIKAKLQDPGDILLNIQSGGTTVFTTSEFNDVDGFYEFDISEANIHKGNQTLRVTLRTSGSIGYDGTAQSISGKTSLQSNNGTNWANLSANGAWVISILLETPPFGEGAFVKNIYANSTQDATLLNWETIIETTPVNSWLVRWKKSKETNFSEETVTNESIVIKGLIAGSYYEAEIAPIENGKRPVNFTSFDFKTETTSAPFPAIFVNRPIYKVDDELPLMLKNGQDNIQSVVFKVNGTVVSADKYKFTTTGNHTVSAEVTYTSGGTETITRKINVNAK